MATGLTTEKSFAERRKACIGDVRHFRIRSVLNRMRHVHCSRLRTERLSLLLGPVLEHMTRNKDTRDAEHFKVQRVVHTARRAAPSIGQCFDNRLALLCDLAAHIHRGRFRKGRLLVTTNLGPLFTEALFQPIEEEIAAGLGDVQ